MIVKTPQQQPPAPRDPSAAPIHASMPDLTPVTVLTPSKLDAEIEAGVIKEARARQRRHRLIGTAAVVVAAAVAALVPAFVGGGGSDAGNHRKARPPQPVTATPASPVTVVHGEVPPSLAQVGLLSPGVGWGVNGSGYFMTRDDGRSWRALKIPGFDGSGDAMANFSAADSPTSRVLVLASEDGSITGTGCTGPEGTAHPTPPLGAVAIGSDAAYSWHVYPFLHCSIPSSLSFVSPRSGFALTGSKPTLLYATTDGARSWRRVASVPPLGSITFANAHDGWAIHPANTNNGIGTLSLGALDATTDGGHTWRATGICDGITVMCQTPVVSGHDVAVTATAVNRTAKTERVFVDTSTDGGHTWLRHAVTSVPSTRRLLPFAATGSRRLRDLFVIVGRNLYTSTDDGQSWARRSTPGNNAWGQIVCSGNGYCWYANGARFYFTTNGGGRWSQVPVR